VQKLARGDSSLGAAWRDGEGEMTSAQAQTQTQTQAQAQATLAIDRLQISTWNIWCPLFRRLEGPGGTQRECEVEGMYLPRNLEVCKPSTRILAEYNNLLYHSLPLVLYLLYYDTELLPPYFPTILFSR